MKFKKLKKQKRRGAAAVEFAFVFPIILTFFVGMIVLTQAFVLKDTAQHAAYEGARKAIVLNSDIESSKLAAKEFLNSMRIRNAKVAVMPTGLSNATGRITVGVSIPYSDNAWIGAGFMPKNWQAYSEITLNRQTGGD